MSYNRSLSSSEVIARLFDIISHLSEDNRRKLLEVLEKRRPSPSTMKREHPRRSFQIPVDFSIDDFFFTYVTQNVSKSGAFIETDLPFLTDKELSMEFELPDCEAPIKTKGVIVRTDATGIGVKFNEPIAKIK